MVVCLYRVSMSTCLCKFLCLCLCKSLRFALFFSHTFIFLAYTCVLICLHQGDLSIEIFTDLCCFCANRSLLSIPQVVHLQCLAAATLPLSSLPSRAQAVDLALELLVGMSAAGLLDVCTHFSRLLLRYAADMDSIQVRVN